MAEFPALPLWTDAYRHGRVRIDVTEAIVSFNSVKRFIEQLGLEEVLDAVDIAMAWHGSYSANREFRYFCGVCWNKLRDAGL